MATESPTVEELEKDILERAGLKKRDDVPICIEATWGGQTFTIGEAHPLIPGHLIFALFQTPTEIKIFSLCPKSAGSKSAKEEMRGNPTRTTLVKTARSTVIEIMILDVFVELIAEELIELSTEFGGLDDPEAPAAKEAAAKQEAAPPAGS